MESSTSKTRGGAKRHLTIVTNLAAPYRDGLFFELQRLFDARIYLLAADEPGRRWRARTIPYQASRARALQLPGRHRPWYFPLPTWLARPGYIMVAGFGPPTIITAMVRPRSTLLWSEATHVTERSRGRLRTLVRRWLIRRCRAGVAAGKASADYLRDLGASDVLLLHNVIDSLPEPPDHEHRPDEDNTPVVLAHVGDWSTAKGANAAASVFATLGAEMRRLGRRVELLIAGHIYDLPIPDGAKYFGYLPHGQVWRTMQCHGATFLLLLSTADTWGFVVPEAVAAGLIPIASPAVGSAPDLLDPVDPALVAGSADDAVAVITRLVTGHGMVVSTLRALQSRASARTAAWSVRQFSDDLASLDAA